MTKQKGINWEIPVIDQAISKFDRHIRSLGFRESTVLDYVGRARRYLEFCSTTEPTEEEAIKFRYVFSSLASQLAFGDNPVLSVPMLPVSS